MIPEIGQRVFLLLLDRRYHTFHATSSLSLTSPHACRLLQEEDSGSVHSLCARRTALGQGGDRKLTSSGRPPQSLRCDIRLVQGSEYRRLVFRSEGPSPAMACSIHLLGIGRRSEERWISPILFQHPLQTPP